jgi:hypothetical protein
VESYGVLIIPGSIFCSGAGADGADGADGAGGAATRREGETGGVRNFFRIGFGRVNFPECLSAFEAALEVILRRK